MNDQLVSILEGSRMPGQLVIADDGSADATLDLVEIALRRARRAGVATTLLRNDGLGVTANFESAIRATTGEIVVLADQDDIWETDRLAIAVDALARSPRGTLHHSDAILIDAHAGEVGRLFEVLGVTEDVLARLADDRALAVLIRRNLVTGATVAIRRELLQFALPFPKGWLHDEWLAILAAATGGVLPERRPLIRYRQHGANQVGVRRVRLREKISRVLGPEGGRTALLATRSSDLVDRLQAIGADAAKLTLVRQKRDFEAARSRLPRNRLARIPGILRLLAGGGYVRLASQGRLDVVRDLLQDRRP